MASPTIEISALGTPERFESWMQAALGRPRLKWLDNTARQLAEAVDGVPELDRFRMAARRNFERGNEPFEVFVVGEGNQGKSTLINALYGAEVAAVDVLPKTWCFHRYVQDPGKAAWVRLVVHDPLLPEQCHLEGRLGTRQDISRGSLAEYECPREQAEVLLAQEEDRTLQSDQYVSPIVEVEWRVPADRAVVASLRLVDTHGLAQLLARPLQQAYFEWEYARADAVLWVLRALKLTSKETRESMEQLSRYRKRIILVLNQMDAIPESEHQLKLDLAHQQFAGKVQAIVPFVGTWAWDGRNDPELLERSGYFQLTTVLDKQFKQKQTLLQQKQRCHAMREQLAACRRGAEELERSLSANHQRFLDASERTDAAVTGATDSVTAWRDRAIVETTARVEERIGRISTSTSASDVRIHLRLSDEESRLQRELAKIREQIRRDLREHAAWLNQNAMREINLNAQGKAQRQMAVYSHIAPTFPAEQIKIAFDPSISVGFFDRAATFLSRIPLFGGLFSGRSARATERVQDSVRGQFEKYLTKLLQEPCEQMQAAILTYADQLNKNISRQLKAQHTVERLERVRQANAGLKKILPPSPFLRPWLEGQLRPTEAAQEPAD